MNPNGTKTSYYFQYGTTTSYGSSTPASDAGSGTADEPVSATVTALASSTKYHYRIVAVSSTGTADGTDKTFTTTTPPAVTTGSAWSITHSSAGVTGVVNPEAQATTYYFRYGTTAAYGLQTTPSSAGAGQGSVAVHARVYGLTANTTYHYQLVAEKPAAPPTVPTRRWPRPRARPSSWAMRDSYRPVGWSASSSAASTAQARARVS